MIRFCFRVVYQNEQAAHYQHHVFPPLQYLGWVNGWARKRSSKDQFLLVELAQFSDRDRFLEICCDNPHVLKVEEISEDEFTTASGDPL